MGGPNWCMGSPWRLDEDGEGVAMLLDADALCLDPGERAPEAILHILQEGAFFRTPCQVNHADAMLADHRLFGVILEVLADDQDHFAIAVALGIRECDVGRERNVA